MYRLQRSTGWFHIELPTLCTLLCLLGLSGLACSKNTTEPSSPPPIFEPQGTSLLLEVVDAQGNPIPRAVISSQNALFSVDSSGHRLFENLSPGRFVARVDALGFASATSVLELHEGAHVGTQVRLLPRPAPISFQAEQGGVVQTKQVRLSFPPSAVVDSLGQPVTGSVDVTIVSPDPTLETPAEPGPPEVVSSANGAVVALESIFMAEVSLWHDGTPAQIAPGKSATLEFVLPQALAPNFKEGDSLPAAFFDLDAGLWREEGAGTIQPSQGQPGQLAWVATVQHFSWWNAYQGLPGTDGLSCANVLVLDSNGNPVPFIPVSVHAWDGVEYRWIGTIQTTGANGRVCVMIKRGLENHILVGSPSDPLVHQKQVVNSEKASCSLGNLCVDVAVTIPPIICSPGAYEPCAYAGPAGTEGVGQCQASRKLCNVTGTAWSACQGEVLPSVEDCDTPFDDDCDGAVNEAGNGCICQSCICQIGTTSDCYTGPAGTQNVGACVNGSKMCLDGKSFGPCMGQKLPSPEVCGVPKDENCDGSLDTACTDGIWTKDFAGVSLDDLGTYPISVDGGGNVVVTGVFGGGITLGGGKLASAGGRDFFLAKVAPNGDLVWSKRYGDADNQQSSALAIDSASNIFIAGTFFGELDFGNGPLQNPPGKGSCFLAKLDPDGNPIWSKGYSIPYGAGSVAITLDGAGNATLVGVFNVTIDFGTGPLNSAGSSDIFVAKFDSGGNTMWSKRFGGANADEARSIVGDSTGNVLLTGASAGALDFGNGPLSGANTPAYYVAKLDGDGNGVWSKSFGDAGGTIASYVAVDAADNVILTGSVTGNLDFGAGPVVGTSEQTFVAKLDAAGNPVWAKRFGGAPMGSSSSRAVATDPIGNIVLGGAFTGSLDFGAGTMTASGANGFIAKLAPDGSTLSSKNFTYFGQNHVSACATDSAGHPFFAGPFHGMIDFGHGVVMSGANDLFLVKLAP